jgi:four helix bundle protein
MVSARRHGMAGVDRFEDLVAWQLCVALKDAVFELTSTGPSARDFQFRDQIRDATSSAPRLLAEGFGRFQPRDFARFCRMARSSLDETRNHVHDARTKKYFDGNDCDRLLDLDKRASIATTRLLNYLLSPEAERWHRARTSGSKGSSGSAGSKGAAPNKPAEP